MGVWERTKDTFDKLGNTQKYSTEEAEEISSQMEGDPSPRTLRSNIGTKAPLDYLEDGETPRYYFKGGGVRIDGDYDRGRSGLLVTDQKIVLLGSSLTSGSQHAIPLGDIIGFSVEQGLPSRFEIQTSGHTYRMKSGKANHDIAVEAGSYIRRKQTEIDPEETESEASPIEKIEQLAELRDKGAISEEEFEAKKTELMREI